MTHSTPAPVAGAVEALAKALRRIVSVTSATPAMSEQKLGLSMGIIQEVAEEALAALHPQPAPAVAVEAERELFEAWMKSEGRGDGFGRAEYNFPDVGLVVGDYLSVWTQSDWEVWLAALAARLSPPTMLNGLTEAETCASASVAGLTAPEKVMVRKPLTDAQIELLRDKTFSVGNPFCPVDSKSMRKVARAIERAHGIGSGSATEGRA